MESKLLPEERRRRIVQILERNGSATVSAIAKMLGVSISTVRNDLNFLENQGLIYRTHGGAMAKERFSPIYQKSISKYSNLKHRIAKKAVELVKPGDVIFVDSGSTTLLFIEELIRSGIECHVITNSLYILNALADVEHIPVHVIGGEFRKRTMNFLDPDPDLESYRIARAFMGVSAFDEEGTYVSNLFEARFKRLIMEMAKEVFVLADSSKYGKVSASFIKNWEEKDTLICDKNVQIKNARVIEAR